MTRRHFEALATALAGIRPEKSEFATRLQWYEGVLAVASVCASANYAFDRSRFIEACKTR